MSCREIDGGTTVTDSGKVLELNQFMDADQRLMTTDLANMLITFEPESILLVDGTQLGEAN